jgi:hypothetical protein
MSIHYVTLDLISYEVNKGNNKTKLPNSEQRESQNVMALSWGKLMILYDQTKDEKKEKYCILRTTVYVNRNTIQTVNMTISK